MVLQSFQRLFCVIVAVICGFLIPFFCHWGAFSDSVTVLVTHSQMELLMSSGVESDMLALLNAKAKVLADEKRKLTEQIETLEDTERDVKSVVDLSEEWKNADYEKKKSVVHLLIDKIYISEDGSVEIIWNV